MRGQLDLPEAQSPLTVVPCPLQVFHYMSITILVFFMMEITFKLFVFRLEFFHHKFEILDTVVVVVSFILDVVLLFQKHQFEALGLLILLRLWRVARIINGMSRALPGFVFSLLSLLLSGAYDCSSLLSRLNATECSFHSSLWLCAWGSLNDCHIPGEAQSKFQCLSAFAIGTRN